MRPIESALVALVLFGAMAGPACSQSAKESIEAALVTFEEAFNSSDAAAVAAHYTEDAALLPPDAAQVDGRQAIEKFWKGAMDSGFQDLNLAAVEESGQVAYEVGTFAGTVPGQGGGQAQIAGKYIVVWKKAQDGVWRLHRDIWNATPAPQ
jgi:uncharacterized protein (TIGR02246 family)